MQEETAEIYRPLTFGRTVTQDEREKRLEISRQYDERITRERANHPSRFSVPDASGCWCQDSDGKRWGKREFERSESRDIARGSRFSGFVYCDCETGSAMLTQEREERQTQDRLWTAHLWERAEIPGRFRHFRFETSPLKLTNPEVLNLIHPETEGLDEWEFEKAYEHYSRSLLLWGNYGSGKTGLAVSRAYDCAEAHESVLFRSVPDLLSELRSTYSKPRKVSEEWEEYSDDRPSEWQVIERYRGVDLLVLDDIGAEQLTGSGWVEDRLYQIIGGRHADDKATVFTSNLSPTELGRRIGERIMWRIVEMCGEDGIIQVKGPNLRQPKGKTSGVKRNQEDRSE